MTRKTETNTIAAFKGFDKNLACLGFQFEVGKTYTATGTIKACRNGFHACENPWDVLGYYTFGEGNRFAKVTLSGATDREKDKIAAETITVEQELTFGEMVGALAAYQVAETKGKGDDPSGNYARIGSSGNCARIGSSGYYARIGSSGYGAQIGSSGYGARIGSSGNDARIGSSGYGAQIGSSGYGAQIGSSGYGAQIGSSGNDAQIGSSGNYARIGSSGNDARIGSSGYGAQIGSSGYGAQIGSSGNDARIGSSGNYAQITLDGSDAVTAVAGHSTWVRASKPAWVSLASYDRDGKCEGFATGQLGVDGLKLDTWYSAEGCKLVECGA